MYDLLFKQKKIYTQSRLVVFMHMFADHKNLDTVINRI